MFTLRVSHNFESAHRLTEPGSPAKCMSVHGHSFRCTVVLEGGRLGPEGFLIEFGAFKSAWRRWIDEHVDHVLILHDADPVGAAVRGVLPDQRFLLVPFSPTAERLAEWLGTHAERVLREVAPPGASVRVRSVVVEETQSNFAGWEAG